MTGLRTLSIAALALPLAAASPEPAARHGAPPAAAQGAPRAPSDCPPRAQEPPNLPRFSDYSAPRRERSWVAPVLSTREARLYRSTLGAEVANGPNFAGDYTLAAWGCGNACTSAAIVAARDGRVFFPPQLRRISTVRIGNWEGGRALRYRGLRFCRDSRLLVVVGQGGEGPAYYEWTGTALRPLHGPRPSPAHR